MSEYLIDRKNKEIASLKEKINELEKAHEKELHMVYIAEVTLFFVGILTGVMTTYLLS